MSECDESDLRWGINVKCIYLISKAQFGKKNCIFFIVLNIFIFYIHVEIISSVSFQFFCKCGQQTSYFIYFETFLFHLLIYFIVTLLCMYPSPPLCTSPPSPQHLLPSEHHYTVVCIYGLCMHICSLANLSIFFHLAPSLSPASL